MCFRAPGILATAGIYEVNQQVKDLPFSVLQIKFKKKKGKRISPGRARRGVPGPQRACAGQLTGEEAGGAGVQRGPAKNARHSATRSQESLT